MTAGLTTMRVQLEYEPAPSAVSISDEGLVERLRGGDVAAGEALAGRYYEPLMRYLQRLVGPQVAEELYQQTWLSVLEYLDRFDPGPKPAATGNGATNHAAADGTGGAKDAAATAAATKEPAGGSFKAWLFRIATNKANDHWRSRGREKVAKDGLRLIADEQHPPAGFRAEGAEQEQKLKRAIEQLPESQRQVLMLRYYGDMKFVDIADLLGCPLNTALGRAHKAILKLRQLMED